jgi:two-component system, NarL family, invasion response regulator UvrY
VIRVLIVDEHPLIRAGLRHEISLHPEFSPPGEAAGDDDALALLATQRWDAVVMEIGYPGRKLGLLPQIRRAHPDLAVVVLSSLPPAQFAAHALKSGARAFVSKWDEAAEVVRAIRRVLAGKTYLSPKVADAIINSVNRSGDVSVERLSEREFQVMRMLACGRTISEIAKEMNMSAKTVSTYRGRALEKMNMRNNSEFMQYAVRLGLVD